jgi:hypothetical protein
MAGLIMAVPAVIPIPYEPDYRTDTISRYAHGQFLASITWAFREGVGLPQDWPRHKRLYAVLHRFDRDGHHLDADRRSTPRTTATSATTPKPSATPHSSRPPWRSATVTPTDQTASSPTRPPPSLSDAAPKRPHCVPALALRRTAEFARRTSRVGRMILSDPLTRQPNGSRSTTTINTPPTVRRRVDQLAGG